MNAFKLLKKTKQLASALAIAMLHCVFATHAYAQPSSSNMFDSIGQQNILYLLIALFALCLLSFMFWMKAKLALVKLTKALNVTKLPIEQSCAGLIQLDANLNVVHCNTFAATLLGRKVDNLVNVPVAGLFSASEQDNIEACLSLPANERSSLTLKAQSSQKFLKVDVVEIQEQAEVLPNGARFIVTLADINTWVHEQVSLSKRQTELELNHEKAGLLEWKLNLKDSEIVCSLGEFKALSMFESSSKVMSFDTLMQTLSPESKKDWQNFIAHIERAEDQDITHHTLELSLIGKQQEQGQETLSQLKLTLLSHTKLQCSVLVQDITVSTHQKLSADAAEFKLQNLIAMSPDPIYILDEFGKLSACNPAFERQFGLRGTQNKGKLLEQLNIMPEKVAQLHVCSTAQVVSKAASASGNLATKVTPINPSTTKTVRINQTVCFDRNNPNEAIYPQEYEQVEDLRKLQIVAQSLRLKGSNQTVVFGFAKDLSEVHHANVQLNKAQSHFENIVNLAPVAIATIDNDDRIVNANTTMLARLGLLEKDLNKGNFYELFNDTSSSGKIAKELHKTGRVRNFFAQLKGKNKELHPSEINIDLFNKDKQEYLCWISDKSAEQFQQDRFESLLTHSSMPMAVLGQHGFSDINPAAMRFFKTDDKQALLHMHPYAQELNGEDAEHLKHIITQVKATGQSQSVSWEHLVKQERMPCHLTLVPLYKGKEFDSILCIWVDLTALKQADQERLYALKLQQKAQAEALEVNKKLQTSQSILASKEKSLAETASELSLVKNDLNEQQSEYQDLKAAHLSVKQHLKDLQSEYQDSCAQLAQVKQDNDELSHQLNESSKLVKQLEGQRGEIAQRLQDSQAKYEQTKQALQTSEARSRGLEQAKQSHIKQMEDFEQQIESMQSSIKEKDQQIAAVGEQITGLQSQLTASDQASDKLKEQLIKQREASEEAEKQRRELEQKVQIAQTELSSKEANLKHIQSEMQKLEELSSIEKGDMQAMQQKLMDELEQKQAALTKTQVELEKKAKEAEQERNEKQEQQALLAQLNNELKEMEASALSKEQDLQSLQQERQALQDQMRSALNEKQAQIQEAQEVLSQAKQETEAERAEKKAREVALEKLQSEIQDLEHKNKQKLEAYLKQEQERRTQHDEQEQEVAAKKEQLALTQARVSALQKQADDERLARLAQQQKVEQLTKELSDVQARAHKQKEMLEGSDEQLREHHEQIEQQKLAFQKALEEAQQQNEKLTSQLQNNLQDLTLAEKKVSTTQSDEQRLQQELQRSKAQAKALADKLASQEEKEALLQSQVQNQQAELEGRERNIEHLQQAQDKLAQELAAVKSEYENSKQSMQNQQANQSELADKLKALESELHISKSQLNEKESALAEVQAQLHINETEKLAQEQALLAAHKQELQDAREQQTVSDDRPPKDQEILALDMPQNPTNWFDLLPYLQGQSQEEPLPVALQGLIDELSALISMTEQAVTDDNRGLMLKGAKQLIDISKKINAEGLSDVVSHMQSDDAQTLLDNISIAWPSIKRAMQNTLRVIYSHLAG